MRLTALLLLAAAPSCAGTFYAKVVDADGKPVDGAVVFVSAAPGHKTKAPDTVFEMKQVEAEFQPGLLAVPVGAKVDFPNKDPFHHHLYSFSSAKKFEIPLYKGTDAEPIVFDKPGVVKVGCNIHDWMSGVILVSPTEWFAATDAEGKAKLDGVPEGKGVEVSVFHPRLRGSVDKTTRPLRLGKKGVGGEDWSIPLKKERAKKAPATGYQ